MPKLRARRALQAMLAEVDRLGSHTVSRARECGAEQLLEAARGSLQIGPRALDV